MEANRREREERARKEAAERLKRPFVDANINTIKAKAGTRLRFNVRDQLLDILEYANMKSTKVTKVLWIFRS